MENPRVKKNGAGHWKSVKYQRWTFVEKKRSLKVSIIKIHTNKTHGLYVLAESLYYTPPKFNIALEK